MKRADSPRRAIVWLSVLGLSAFALGLATSLPKVPRFDISSSRAELISKVGPVRPLKGRLAGLEYLPLEFRIETFAGHFMGYISRPPEIEPAQIRNVALFAQRIQEGDEKKSRSQTLGDMALLVLLRQKPERLHEALSLLEAAVAENPKSASLWSDLAAGYLASTRPEPPNQFLALAAASRAIQEDPSLLEARYNLALAFEECSLFQQARRAWEDYVRFDSASGWAAEARSHLRKLRRPSPRESWNSQWKRDLLANQDMMLFPSVVQIAREDVTEEILGRWAALLSKNKIYEANRELEAAQRISSLFLRGTLDKTVPDTIAVILSTDRKDQLAILQEGHQAYSRGIRHLRAGNVGLAKAQLQIAKERFKNSGSPLRYWIDFALAEIAYRQSDSARVEELVERIRSRANLTRYSSLNARLFWIEGLSRLSRSSFSLAQTSFSSARSASSISGEREFRGVVDMYAAESVEPARRPDWFHLHVALHELGEFQDSPYLPRLFKNLAKALEGYPQAALHLLNEGLEDSLALQDPSVEVDLLIERIRVEGRLGDKAAVRLDLIRLQESVEKIEDPESKIRWNTEVGVARCQHEIEMTAVECIVALSAAIDDHERHEQADLPFLYRARAKAHGQLGEITAQESDLLTGIGLYEKSNPVLLFRRLEVDDLFEEMVTLQLSRQNIGRAFEFEERSKAVYLPSRKSAALAQSIGFGWGGNLRPYSCRELVYEFPKHTTLIEYEVSGERITAWIFRGRTVERVALAVKRRQLLRHLKPLLAGRPENYISSNLASPQLSQWLLVPLLPWLPREGDFLFVTDPVVSSVDFRRLLSQARESSSQSSGVAFIPKRARFSFHGNLSEALSGIRATLCEDMPRGEPSGGRWDFTAESIQRSLPNGTTLIEYVILGDRLLIWVMGAGRLDVVSVSVSRNKLGSLVDEYLRELRRSWSSKRAAADALQNLLIEPVRDFLPEKGNLVVVSEQALVKLPFSSLRNPRTGKYLIEDYSISITPSAGLYVRQLQRSSGSDHKTWTVAVLGTSRQDPREVSLSEVNYESSSIARLFPGSETFSGEQGVVPRSESLYLHEVVHFSGHYSSDSYPSYGASISADNLPVSDKTRLVVLSACNTLMAPLQRTEHGFGLAAALLSGNIPAVIATSWEVDDFASSRLLVRFYEHFRAGMDGANALRAAQLDLLHGADRSLQTPDKWAGFQFLGFGGI